MANNGILQSANFGPLYWLLLGYCVGITAVPAGLPLTVIVETAVPRRTERGTTALVGVAQAALSGVIGRVFFGMALFCF
jgi:hypothetical protein